MIAPTTSLDLIRLEKVRQSGSKIIARCPACAETGGDRKGNHLTIFPSGKFACAAVPGDSEHRRRVFALVGISGEHKPVQQGQWRKLRHEEERRSRERQRLNAIIREKRHKLIERHGWDDVNVWEDSPQRIDSDLVEHDPRHFLASLFPSNAVVWTGDLNQSGVGHANRWRTVAEWQNAELGGIGPMTTAAVWHPDRCNRIAENVLAAPYVVLDFDGFDGIKPEKPEEIEKHRRDSLALIRWIREGLRWQLAAIVWTGSKSHHAWFRSPPVGVVQSLRDTAATLGIDAGFFGRPGHCCRLPGQSHEKTGATSRVLWLDLAG